MGCRAREVPRRLRRVQGGHWVDDRQPDLRDDQAEHVGLRPAGEPEAVDDRRVATAGLEEDPDWRQKMIGGYTDCYQVASNWPQQSLDRNPITKVFGRHMIFFKCAMKQEKKMCGMAQMYSWLKTLYGDSDDFNWSQFGLPQDKYDRAALTIMVQTQA